MISPEFWKFSVSNCTKYILQTELTLLVPPGIKTCFLWGRSLCQETNDPLSADHSTFWRLQEQVTVEGNINHGHGHSGPVFSWLMNPDSAWTMILDVFIYGDNQGSGVIPPTSSKCTTMEGVVLWSEPAGCWTATHTCMSFREALWCLWGIRQRT